MWLAPLNWGAAIAFNEAVGPVWMVARVEMRRRWRALLGLALLVGFVSATIFTALVEAQRASTSVDRLREWSAASDASFQSNTREQADNMYAAALTVAEIESVCERSLVNAFVVDGLVPDIALMTDPAGHCGVDIDRPHLLAGRMPDPAAPNEIMLNELAARLSGLHVGDHVLVNTWSATDLEELFTGTSFPGFNGPQLDLNVVGIGRVIEELPGDIQRTSPYALSSSGLLAAHPELGAWPPSVYVRVRDGEAGIAAASSVLGPIQFGNAVSGPGGAWSPGSTARAEYLDSSRRSVNSIAVGLLIFGGGAAVAGALMLGLAIMRLLGRSSASTSTLGQLGLGRPQRAMALTIPIAIAIVAGSIIGVATAILASPLLPIGLARRAEVSRGISVHPEILIPGLVLVIVALALFTYVKAFKLTTLRIRSDSTSRRISTTLKAARLMNVPPTIDIGFGLALERRRGSKAVPLRSAFIGLALGIAGVVAAGAIGTSFHSLTSHPAQWGWNWSSTPDYFGDDDLATLESQMVDDHRLAAVGNLIQGTVLLKGLGNGTTAYAMESLSGHLAFTQRTGRAPIGPNEVAFTSETMDKLDIAVGDSIEIVGADGSLTANATVVGTVVLPSNSGSSSGTGAVFSTEGLDRFGLDDENTSTLVLQFPASADVPALEAALADDYGLQFNVFTESQTPGIVRNLGVSNDIAKALAWFFAALAAVGMLHALVVTVQHSSQDNAVLRALGFRPRQVRNAILTQSVVLGTAAGLIGVPTGLVLGRFVWRLLAKNTEAITPPLTPWLILALVLPAALAVVALLSWWPGRVAVRRRPGAVLRTDLNV